MVSPPEYGGVKYARYVENNIFISYLTFHNILAPQLKQMTFQYKVMCGCECCIFTKIMHSSLLTWCDHRLKYLKDRSHNAQNTRSGKISSRIFETYNNAVGPHGCNIYNTTSEMAIEKMCPCTSKHRDIMNFKCVIHCLDKCPIIPLSRE